MRLSFHNDQHYHKVFTRVPQSVRSPYKVPCLYSAMKIYTLLLDFSSCYPFLSDLKGKLMFPDNQKTCFLLMIHLGESLSFKDMA